MKSSIRNVVVYKMLLQNVPIQTFFKLQSDANFS